jgi:hypothetical protein
LAENGEGGRGKGREGWKERVEGWRLKMRKVIKG